MLYHKLIKVTLVVGLLVAMGSILIVGYSVYIKRTAASILRDVSSLTVDQSSFDDVYKIVERYHNRVSTEWIFGSPRLGIESKLPLNACSRDTCMFNFRVNNEKLAKLSLLRPAEFTASVVVSKDRVYMITIGLFGRSEGYPGASVGYGDRDEFFLPNPRRLAYRLWQQRASALFVDVRPGATAVERQHAFAFDMKCLAAIRHCNSPGEYMPDAWADFVRLKGTDAVIERPIRAQ